MARTSTHSIFHHPNSNFTIIEFRAMAFKSFWAITVIAMARGAMTASLPFAVGSPYDEVVHGIPGIDMARQIDSYGSNPRYNYGYNVQDAMTGDSKTQHEVRDGDVVKGSYSLVEPDGMRRIVDYTADPVNGFNAVVRKEPAVIKSAIAPAPVTLSQPLAVARHFAVARPFSVVHAPLSMRFATSPYGALGLAYH